VNTRNVLNAKRKRKRCVRCLYPVIIVTIGAVYSVLLLPLLLDVDSEAYLLLPLLVLVIPEDDHVHLHLAGPTHAQDPLPYAVADPLHVVLPLSRAPLSTLIGVAYLVHLVRLVLHPAVIRAAAAHPDDQLIQGHHLPVHLLHALSEKRTKDEHAPLSVPSLVCP